MKFYLKIVLFPMFGILLSQCDTNGQSVDNQNIKSKKDTISTHLKTEKSDDAKVVSFIFTGDIMQHELQVKSAYYEDKKAYDFHSQFENVKPIFDTTDVVVGNFEVTLGGPPYSGYPSFSTPDALLYAVKDAGFKYLGFANNHVYDKGKKGFERTLNMFDSLDMPYTGGFLNAADKAKRHPLVIEENGMRIALFNYTYGVNGNMTEAPNLLNIYNKDMILKDLKQSETENFDARIIYFHWGTEYERVQLPSQTELANFCFENGADVVIGAHPHVIEPMEYKTFTKADGSKKQVLVAYSLGNFVSNYATWRYADGGAMISFKFRKEADKPPEIIQPEYHLIWVYRPVRAAGDLRRYSVLPVVDFEHDTKITDEHRRLFDRFITDSRELYNKHNVNVPEVKKRK